MKRGEIWSAAGKKCNNLNKPRPVLIVQANKYDATSSILICPITSCDVNAPLLRPSITPSEENKLKKISYVEVDKLAAARKSDLGALIGRLSVQDMMRISDAVRDVLDL